MTDRHTHEQARESNTIKDPDDWTTGDEPMTGAQRSYLRTLSEEARVPVEENLTKAEASKQIEELQEMTGRGAYSRDEGEGTAPSAARPVAPREQPR